MRENLSISKGLDGAAITNRSNEVNKNKQNSLHAFILISLLSQFSIDFHFDAFDASHSSLAQSAPVYFHSDR